MDVPSAYVNGVAFRSMGKTTIVREGAIGRVVRRIEFDHELARIAEARGIRIVQGARVDAIDVRSDGVRVESSAGSFRARVLVGADGVGTRTSSPGDVAGPVATGSGLAGAAGAVLGAFIALACART